MNRNDAGEQWTADAEGELQSMVARLRRAHRAQRLQGFIVPIALCVVLVSIGIYAGVQLGGDPTPGGLTCQRVQQLISDFQADRLEAPLRDRVRIHVQQCDRCRAALGRTARADRPLGPERNRFRSSLDG